MHDDKLIDETKFRKERQNQRNGSHSKATPIKEIDGFKGPEPTRFGDWEKNGRCIDF